MENEKLYCYKYPRPAVTTDCIVWTWDKEELKVLLIERGGEPFSGHWALPGGFMEMDEDATACARRELAEETGIDGGEMEQLYAFSAVDRDPRFRVVSIAYYTFISITDCWVLAGDDAKRAEWFAITDLPELAFDHGKILKKALERLREDITLRIRSFRMITERFSETERKAIVRAILQSMI